MQIGDLVPKSGIYTDPGVVVAQQSNGDLVVNTDKRVVDYFHRYTNTTGLSLEGKNEFNSILDQIYQRTSDVDKIEGLQAEIDRLQADPSKKKMLQYLRNQQSYLIRKSKTLPTVYTMSSKTASQIRTPGAQNTQETHETHETKDNV